MVASPAPQIIAAAAAAARRRLRRAFRDADAYSPVAAIAYQPHRRLERRYFERLIDDGAAVEAKPGYYYLDEAKFAAYESRRRKRALTMIAIVLGGAAAMFGLTRV